MKLCIDCRHFKQMEYAACFNPKLGLSRVDGKVKDRPAAVCRGDDWRGEILCGEKGEWWQEKPVAMKVAEALGRGPMTNLLREDGK